MFNITPEQIDKANQYAEIICSEINVKQLAVDTGIYGDGSLIELVYKHNTITDSCDCPWDLYKKGIPLRLPHIAAYLYLKTLEVKDA